VELRVRSNCRSGNKEGEVAVIFSRATNAPAKDVWWQDSFYWDLSFGVRSDQTSRAFRRLEPNFELSSAYARLRRGALGDPLASANGSDTIAFISAIPASFTFVARAK
jgi:hypothetical protein